MLNYLNFISKTIKLLMICRTRKTSPWHYANGVLIPFANFYLVGTKQDHLSRLNKIQTFTQFEFASQKQWV